MSSEPSAPSIQSGDSKIESVVPLTEGFGSNGSQTATKEDDHSKKAPLSVISSITKLNRSTAKMVEAYDGDFENKSGGPIKLRVPPNRSDAEEPEFPDDISKN